MAFRDRQEAAGLLAERLSKYKGQNPLVLAIPRGAVPMAALIADALDGELDVVLVHKLGAPGNPEFAIGSVDEQGHVELAEHTAALHIEPAYIEHEVQAELEVLRARRARYTPVRPPIDPAGRIVIVVDDGIATGSTLLAALRAVRAKQPKRLVAAVGVGPPDTLERLKVEADELVCLEAPEFFYAVGQFFRDFAQVTDEQVINLLGNRGAGAQQVGRS